MNQIIENILTRRSVRDFTDQAISKSDLELLIKAGLYAPSGRNQQSWHFIGVLNQNKIQSLAKAVGQVAKKENYTMFNPTALIIVSNERDNPYGPEDNACALQNIFLAGHSMGIGSCWINQMNSGNCDAPEVRSLLTELGVPENHVVYGIASLGYLASEPRGIIEKKGTFSIVE